MKLSKLRKMVLVIVMIVVIAAAAVWLLITHEKRQRDTMMCEFAAPELSPHNQPDHK